MKDIIKHTIASDGSNWAVIQSGKVIKRFKSKLAAAKRAVYLNKWDVYSSDVVNHRLVRRPGPQLQANVLKALAAKEDAIEVAAMLKNN